MTTPIALPTAGSRAEWLEQRRQGVGASDASAILGLSAWESAYSLWEQKTGRVPLDVPVTEDQQELMDWGNLLEPVIREETARRLGVTIEKPEHAYAHPDRLWQRVNPDGLTPDGVLFEAKNTHYRMAHLWEGQVPDHAEVQVHHGAAVLGATHAIVAGLVGGNRLYVHEVTINPTVVQILTEQEGEFWDYVQRDTPPPVDGHLRTMQALTREWAHRPGVKEVAQVEVEDHWQAYRDADARLKAAERDKAQALAQITALMDGHDELVTGGRVWAKVQRTQMNLKRLTADHPDLVAEYTTKPTFDLAAFKAAQPDLYRQYQGVSVRPKAPKNDVTE